MDYKAFYISLQTRREQSIVLRDALLDLQRQWVQWNPLPLTAEDPLGDDLYTAYNLIHQAIQKIPTFDWAKDTGGLKPVDGAQSFEAYAVAIKGKGVPALCEDCDPNCPVCHGHCSNEVVRHLFRVDMEDNTGIGFCDACADDAMKAGVFDTEAGRTD